MRPTYLMTLCGLCLCLAACGGGGGGEDEGTYGNTTQPSFDAQRFSLFDEDGEINDVVLDRNTGLTWTRTAWYSQFVDGWYTGDGVTMTQVWQLLGAMNELKIGGYNDWRMPKIGELRQLWEGGVTNSGGFFKGVFQDASYWSSDDGHSCLPPSLGSACYDYQVCLYFETGTAVQSIMDTYFLWPVRG